MPPDAASHFLSSMTGELVPTIAGQDGPTIDQILARGLKLWKAYASDEEQREALGDWFERVADAVTATPSDPLAATGHRTIMSYIDTTRGYIFRFGHQLVHKYHKRVAHATERCWYDPHKDGPVSLQAYTEILSRAADKTSKLQSTTRQASSKAAASTRVKRLRSDEPGGCTLHPNRKHSQRRLQLAASEQAAGSGQAVRGLTAAGMPPRRYTAHRSCGPTCPRRLRAQSLTSFFPRRRSQAGRVQRPASPAHRYAQPKHTSRSGRRCSERPSQLWRDTLADMARLPDADTTLLRQIAAWVTDGITLDLVSWPPAANHE